jgi:hypothetical protein
VPSDKAAAITRVFKLFIRIVPPVACCCSRSPNLSVSAAGHRPGQPANRLKLAGAIDPLAACLKHL